VCLPCLGEGSDCCFLLAIASGIHLLKGKMSSVMSLSESLAIATDKAEKMTTTSPAIHLPQHEPQQTHDRSNSAIKLQNKRTKWFDFPTTKMGGLGNWRLT
jgi:hypothetical protein